MKRICIAVIAEETSCLARIHGISLANELAKAGNDVHVLATQKPKIAPEDKFVLHSLEIPKLPNANRYKRYRHNKFIYRLKHSEMIKRLQSKFKEMGPFDLVISNLTDLDFLFIAAKIPNLYCCIHRDIKSEIYFPSMRKRITKLTTWLQTRQRKNFYKKQNLVTVSQEMIKTILKLGIRPSSIEYICNIYDFEEIKIKSIAYKVEEQDYIIYVGRFAREKNIRMLLESYVASNVKSKLLLLGFGNMESEINLDIEELGITDRVILKHFTPNPFPYIKKAKALVLASNMEGLPTVLIEALILRTPVVSTSCPTGPKEILTGELAEFLSPVGDRDALAHNIRKVIENPPKILEEHIAKFHKDISVRKYLNLLN